VVEKVAEGAGALLCEGTEDGVVEEGGTEAEGSGWEEGAEGCWGKAEEREEEEGVGLEKEGREVGCW